MRWTILTAIAAASLATAAPASARERFAAPPVCVACSWSPAAVDPDRLARGWSAPVWGRYAERPVTRFDVEGLRRLTRAP